MILSVKCFGWAHLGMFSWSWSDHSFRPFNCVLLETRQTNPCGFLHSRSLGQFVHMMKRQVTMHMCVFVAERERIRGTQKHARLHEASAQSRHTVISTTVHCSSHQTVQNQGVRKQTSAFNNRSYRVTLQGYGNRKDK